MKKVALNGRFTGSAQPTGTQIASFHLFDGIIRERGDIELVVFADPRFPGTESWRNLEGVTFVDIPFQDWTRLRCHFWEQLLATSMAWRQGCKLMHHPMTTSPSLQRDCVLHLVTLHDLNFYLHPEWYSRLFRMLYALCAVPGLRHSACVVTISHYVRNCIRATFPIPDSRLKMIYNGTKPMRAESPLGGNYILAVGSLQPHKNLARMIRAYRSLQGEHPGLELIVAGRSQEHFSHDPDLAGLLASPGVRLTGYLSEEQLANAYAGARAFCFPSLEEGFGLPILEAMTLGCPVLTSNVSCLPEIAGPAVLVDPRSVDAIAAGLRRILQLSEKDRNALVIEGELWAERFTWRKAALEYLGLYRTLLS